MATFFLLCGLPGSGKSTLARRLETEYAALRLLPDEWIARLDLGSRDEVRRAEIERIQMEIAARVLNGGCNVISEAGFWRRSERAAARAIAAAAGAGLRLIWLDVPLSELQRRIEVRNRALPENTFLVHPGELEGWLDLFEAPTADETPEPPPA